MTRYTVARITSGTVPTNPRGRNIAVDRLTKDIIFILFKEAATADKLVYIFLRDILAEHTLPEELITDRDKLFISKF